ncbi:three-helix bundle dimerization domain-containing protein [Microbacterium sp. P01]|uniref:three-helix bundle dimerization domain-containing protein n=1 Tax=unclassified Microbacterium TaxID=2609290 RepID=UPI00366E345F
MSVTNPENEYEALVHLIRRVSARFPDADEDAILAMTAEELERFDGARLRDYVPVLVEHNVVRRLRARGEHAA